MKLSEAINVHKHSPYYAGKAFSEEIINKQAELLEEAKQFHRGKD